MPKSSEAKVNLAKKLLEAGMPQRDVQKILQKTFGSGMSNTTFQKIMEKNDEVSQLKEEIETLQAKLEKSQHDLALYKHLYFELLQTLKK
ncbi:hypothetical protein NEF87_000971 [Candidatus Lokiarchaeum ossiferum]|uniref:Uncharacterized protein n=1 Tax=Candidatus Lokiarchaeum ossiferum TaxID=2951803 RepID=A0ABY6HQ64_9ARCH|nr:hypothetical protein NEF87_000971 [Candidatus Lokiarchaeum sp. B-35]